MSERSPEETKPTGTLCEKCGVEDHPAYGCACGCDFSVMYCQGCGAAPHIDGSHCHEHCPVQLYREEAKP